MTTPCECGTSRQGSASRRSRVTRFGWVGPDFRQTARSWYRRAVTWPCECGD